MSINIISGMQRSTKQFCWVFKNLSFVFGSSNVFPMQIWDSFQNKKTSQMQTESNIAILWCTLNLSVSTAVWIFWRESVTQDRGKIYIDRPQNKWVLTHYIITVLNFHLEWLVSRYYYYRLPAFQKLFPAFLPKSSAIWQYGLWSFQTGGTKLEIFLPKNQYKKIIEIWESG